MRHKPNIEQARAIEKRKAKMARNLALALDALGDLLRPTGIEIIKSVVRKLDPETAFFLGYGFAVAGQQFLKELESEARPDRPKK